MPVVRLTLNAQRREVEVRSGESLLETLKERCGVTSLKSGCRPQGQCGACLVLIDGKPRVSCALPAERAEGREVLTIEGLSARERDLLSRAFVQAAGLQCGFCTPGFALRAKALVDRKPEPTRDEIRRALDVHLCRCTGYVGIVEAVELYARARRGDESCLGAEPDAGVGRAFARHQGADLVLGRRAFVGDLRLDGMLHGALRLSDHARALVLRVDTSRAEALPGVHRVVTARDVPGRRRYGLVSADWPGFVAEGEEVRCAGDVLAAVAAADEGLAREAAALIEVDYKVREPVVEPKLALQPGAHPVNPAHGTNLLSQTVLRRGDVSAALANAAHVVEESWSTQRVEHLYLEPEAALAVPEEGGRLHLYTQGQGIFEDRRQVAGFLGLREEQIFVELVPAGGAFGGKEDLSVQAQTALLAMLTGRPVRLLLDRRESIRLHPKRHPMELRYQVGCDAEGRLLGVRADIVGDTGAYASVGAKVLERAASHACGPYRVDNVDVRTRAVLTNNPPSGAMRGFGVCQVHFAMEGCMDLLAERCGIDPWEMRWRNAVEVGDKLATGQVLESSVGLKETLRAVRPAYRAAREAGRAAGIACGIKNSGIGNGARERGRARLVVEGDGTVSLYNGFSEMGQGLLTICVQIAHQVTGLPASLFRPRVDSTFELDCGQTTGSRATLFAGPAVEQAAARLRADLVRGLGLTDLVGRVYAGEVLVDDTTPTGDVTGRVKPHTAYGYATQVVVLDGDGRLDRVVAAHDLGRALNPALCKAQIEGSVHMGLGYALSEELPCEEGMPLTYNLKELGPLRARDMPEVEVILVEDPEPAGPFGAKGLGEVGMVATAAAVAAALHGFDGIRRTSLPMRDSPAARALSVGRIKLRK